MRNNGKQTGMIFGVCGLLLLTAGCVSTRTIKEVVPASQIDSDAVIYDVPPGLKYRVAISRFEDKTGYGKNLFGVIDDLGEQAADVLASHLIKSGRVIVVERAELTLVQAEQELQGQKPKESMVWASALILGSVTEFGTKTEYQRAVFEKQKDQVAHAKVTIRMVDPETGVAFFSEFGEADAIKTSTMKMGYGGASDYDATLTDKALNGAVVKLVNNLLHSLINRPWGARIIDVQGDSVFINAGEHAGLKRGDALDVILPGKKVKNPTTNATIQLPGTKVGTLQVESFFGDTEINEGAVCKVTSGPTPTMEHIVQTSEVKI
jgi:curli biogenesis system outer membrane secretion channel CsgG